MDNDATPVLIEDEATTPAPFLTMVELVYGEDEPKVCQVCADRGTTHIPDDEL